MLPVPRCQVQEHFLHPVLLARPSEDRDFNQVSLFQVVHCQQNLAWPLHLRYMNSVGAKDNVSQPRLQIKHQGFLSSCTGNHHGRTWIRGGGVGFSSGLPGTAQSSSKVREVHHFTSLGHEASAAAVRSHMLRLAAQERDRPLLSRHSGVFTALVCLIGSGWTL